jgi:iron complex transport system substrate-binding protein
MKVLIVRCLQIGVFVLLLVFLESVSQAQTQTYAQLHAHAQSQSQHNHQHLSHLSQSESGLKASHTQSSLRLITLGGSVTEIVYALGAGDLIVATDQSSQYPPQATKLPSMGYYRRVPVEGVAAFKPSLVLASEHAGPHLAISQIKDLGIPVEQVSDEASITSLRARIRHIAKVLGCYEAGENLIKQVDQRIQTAQRIPVQLRPTLLIVMRSGKLLGAGANTTANVLIMQSGLSNVLSQLKGYQVITPEAVTVVSPEVVIVTRSTVKALGGIHKIKTHPALMHTPAVKNGHVIELDDLLAQGYGPRVGLAIQQIREALTHE